MAYDRDGARFETPCPVARVERGTFERMCDVSGGLRINRVVSFEAELSWIRESDCRAVVVDSDGIVVHDGGAYTDFYGFLTSIDRPLGTDAGSLVRQFDVRPDGRLRVEVRLDASDIPAVVDRARPEGAVPFRRGFVRIPHDWCRAPCAELAAIREAWSRGEVAPYGLEVPYVGTREHPTVTLFDSRDGLDVASQAALAWDRLAPLVEGLPEEHAARARKVVAGVLADIDGAVAA